MVVIVRKRSRRHERALSSLTLVDALAGLMHSPPPSPASSPEPEPDSTNAVDSTIPKQTEIDRLYHARVIAARHWQAAEWLLARFQEAEFEATSRSGYGDAGIRAERQDPLSISLEACEARRDYIDALRAVPIRASGLVVHVCCTGQPVKPWAAAKRIPISEAHTLLRLGLDHLANHLERVTGGKR